MIKLELKQLREKTTDFFGVYSLTFVLFIVSDRDILLTMHKREFNSMLL